MDNRQRVKKEYSPKGYGKNNHNKDKVKTYLFVGAVLVVLYWVLNHLSMLGGYLEILFNMLMPFILGSAIAFVFNVPMRSIEKHIFTKDKYKTPKMLLFKRVLSYIITLFGIILVLTLTVLVVMPQLVDTITDIFNKIPDAFNNAIAWVTTQLSEYPEIEEKLNSIVIDWQEIAKTVANFIFNDGKGIITDGIGAVSNLFSGFASFFIGFVFSIYLLFQKEKLVRQSKKVVYAMLPRNKAERVIRIARLSNSTFSNFISGQCLEAVILGTMFVIVMTIFRMPYALLIGVSIAVLALIPIVGAFIGCGLGVILIAMVNPLQALVFFIMFLVLQQIEGNLIYPYVVGNSVGLPGMWVLVAVTVGGNLLGVVGMLTFIPICSVAYALFREYINNRLAKKHMDKMEELYGLEDIVESAKHSKAKKKVKAD